MSMTPEIRAAIESARSTGLGTDRVGGPRARYRSFDATRAVVLAVLQELPADLTVGELADELQIAENQGPR